MTIYIFQNQKTNTSLVCTDPLLEIPENFKDTVLIYSEDEAQALCKQAQDDLLLAETSRFNINEEVVDGENTIWQVADLSKGSEESIYQVFNPDAGTYDKVIGITAAQERQILVKQKFIASSSVNLVAIDSFPIPLNLPKNQPKSDGMQTI